MIFKKIININILKHKLIVTCIILGIILVIFCILSAILSSKSNPVVNNTIVSSTFSKIETIVKNSSSHINTSSKEEANYSKSVASSIKPLINEQKIAYLTFDDGPTDVTSHLIDVLDENKVKATFFIAFMSKDTLAKRALVKREFDDGNIIGVHSWTHKYNYIYASEQNFLADFKIMDDIIISITGVQPKICRFPGGISNTVSIKASNGQIIMPKLLDDVHEMGFKAFDWNVGGQDAIRPYPTKDEFVKIIVNGCKGLNKVVILMHDTHEVTVDSVPDIIQQLRALGYTFDTLSPESATVQQHFAKISSIKINK